MEDLGTPQLVQKTFVEIRDYLFRETGISLHDHKIYLARHRLSKFVGIGKAYTSFEEFFRAVQKDVSGNLKTEMINVLTTNFSYFFREPVHFDFLHHYLKKQASSQEQIRLWSAACSTGEEPYSLSITAQRAMPDLGQKDFKILATDISTTVLKGAMKGVYHYNKVRGHIENSELKRYFTFDRNTNDFMVSPDTKNVVAFRYLNLLGKFPFQRLFDVVFLRNVLIYFDTREKEIVIRKIYDFIKPGGYLILGLSESLVGINHSYKSMKNSIYQKKQNARNET